MKVYETPRDCCGCTACANICPQKCIKMEPDKEGFLYPQIDSANCKNCNMCKKVCPANKDYKMDYNDIDFYAARIKDEEIILNSSSGGIFSAFACSILKNGGLVFGAVFDNDFKVIHAAIDNEKDLEKLRGSKYVQSDMLDMYKQVQKQLEGGRFVLFPGTPCQIAGLKSFLNRDYEKLVLVDLACHGVPSPAVYHDYFESLSNKYGAKISRINFRDKKNGRWGDQCLNVVFENRLEYLSICRKDLFYKAFLDNLILRPACYKCSYNNFRSGSDLTIADFWGGNNLFPEYNDGKGISLVLAKTARGKDLFRSISGKINFKKANVFDAVKDNLPLLVSPVEHEKRSDFFNDYIASTEPINETLAKYITFQEKIEPIKINYNLSLRWINLKTQNLSVDKFLLENNYINIAIYGAGELGKLLYYDLLDSKVNVKYFIDSKTKVIEGISIPSISPEQLAGTDSEIDAIIITPVFAYDTICVNLSKYTNVALISLEKLMESIN